MRTGFFYKIGVYMEIYELEPDKIINWAIEANFEELEGTAKAIYSIYKARQKQEQPENYKKAKQYKKQYKSRGKKR